MTALKREWDNLILCIILWFNTVTQAQLNNPIVIKRKKWDIYILIYKPDSKKVGTLYKLWIKKECNNLQIS